MRFLLIILPLIFAFCQPVFASCYTQAEAEAEQGLRIHSELMVIALNCQHMTNGGGSGNLYSQYRRFTSSHADLFAGYERTLISHFASEGSNAEGKLHDMRTRFANDISMQSARQRPDIFCQRYAGRVPRAASFSRAQLQDWAATPYPGHALSRPLCASMP